MYEFEARDVVTEGKNTLEWILDALLYINAPHERNRHYGLAHQRDCVAEVRLFALERLRGGDGTAGEDEEDGDADRIDAVLDEIMEKFETDTGINLLSLAFTDITDLKCTTPHKQGANVAV